MLEGETVICYHCPPPLTAISSADINQPFMRDVEPGVWLCHVERDTMKITEMGDLQLSQVFFWHFNHESHDDKTGTALICYTFLYGEVIV